jgi:endonuclease III-like uncharacterized protein
LDPFRLAASNPEQVKTLIHSSGFQRQKSQTLLALSQHLSQHSISFEEYLARPMIPIRCDLLALHGIGPETADSILLYAGGHETFVVDAYLRRFLAGAGFSALSRSKYEELRLTMEKLVRGHQNELERLVVNMHTKTPSHPPTAMSLRQRSPLVDMYNELHAVIVRDGVEKRKPGAYAPGLNEKL